MQNNTAVTTVQFLSAETVNPLASYCLKNIFISSTLDISVLSMYLEKNHLKNYISI